MIVTIREGDHLGRGESVPYARYDETIESVMQQIQSCPDGLSNAERYMTSMAPGAARNALDCALWDLRAQREGRSVAEILGLSVPKQNPATLTLSVGAPEQLSNQARNLPSDRCIKMKLNGDRDLDKIQAVRAVQPTAPLWLDANESWSPECYAAWTPHLTKLGVELLEQPFPAGEDHVLKRLPRPVPVVADESLHTREDLKEIRDRYDGVNIKLDKTGGLTEALALRDEARAVGLKVMIGCMVCTSLSIAPAWLLTSGAAWIDLDGPALLERDRSLGATFDGNSMYPPSSGIWGHPRVT